MKNRSNVKNRNDMERKAGLKRTGLLFGVILFLFVAGVTLNSCGASKVKTAEIVNQQTDYRVNPVGIDDPVPVFSWQMSSDEKDKSQSAYRIMVWEHGIEDEEITKKSREISNYVWDSGKVEGDLSISIPYEGEELKPQTRYDWTVEVWDEEDKIYTSEAAYFETGLMGDFPKEAHWISIQDTFADENLDLQSSDTIDTTYTTYIKDDMTVDSDLSYSTISTYSIQYTMEVQNTSACFVFGAVDGWYGSMTLCEIWNQDEETVFTVKDMAELNSGIEFPAAYIDTAEDGSYQVNLQVKDQQMKVTVNDGVIGEFPIPGTSLGAIGYYKSRGTQYAYLDDIVVKDELGNICYAENFEEESTIFAPYHIVIENGRCKVGSGLMLSGGVCGRMEDPAPVFERTIELEEKEIDHARLYLTALGSYEVSLDGQKVTDNFMDPGKLAYNQYLSYMTYDVTELLKGEKQGEEQTENGVISASHTWRMTLLHGWYDRGVGYPEIYSPWGEKNALRGALIVTYRDGTQQVIGTDEEFQVTLDGSIRKNDVYQGEFYDASRAMAFSDSECKKDNVENNIEDNTEDNTEDSKTLTAKYQCGIAAVTWQPAAVDEIDPRYDEIPYIGKANEPIRCVQELTPISVSEPVSGTWVYDFGQNFAGVCRIKMNAGEGDLVTLRYGEALNTEKLGNKDDAIGTIWTENLLTADATDYYLAVDGEQTYQPVSVYHGFRYLQITGLKEAPALEDVTGIVLSSDLTLTGEFECSDELVNRYFSNAVWSQRSNFVDNPTDCAQRDERHGWAGDAQIFSGMACYNSRADDFYRKYLTELCTLQSEDGAFPDMAPRNFGTGWAGRGGAGGNNCWGDAAVVIAWNLYTQYGDVNVLEEHYEALCKWVDYLEEHSENGLRSGETGYGDHFSVESTPKGLTDTAWSAHSAELLSKISTILGKKQEAVHYQQLFEQFRDAWLNEYVSEDGMIECYSQTAYALGLEFQLFPEELRQTAADCLLNNITFNRYEFHVGYAGLSYLLPALSEAGYSDTAYEMLCYSGERSLLYPVTQGATTTPEYLSAYQEIDGELILDGSLNHYAYGAPAKWLYTHVLGIQSDEEHPGFKHFYVKPEVTGKWTHAKGAYESMYGRIEVSWEQKKDGEGYEYHLVIPANTTATVELEGMERMELGSGTYEFEIKN